MEASEPDPGPRARGASREFVHGRKRIEKLFGKKLSTVNTHVKRIYRKLNVSDERQLVIKIVGEYLAWKEGIEAPRHQGRE